MSALVILRKAPSVFCDHCHCVATCCQNKLLLAFCEEHGRFPKFLLFGSTARLAASGAEVTKILEDKIWGQETKINLEETGKVLSVVTVSHVSMG
uniref:Uncharacterized protein n=1 Tax=Ditylenchus dipsaci TaxID=166011 RepID=A0A915E5H2_9BILA